ncbi:Sir2 family NAD-dependent protein deacetylase [Bacteroidetes bacterium endosymbiont of Geopemphigus sp.]|uniref:Sir2 family NAD-dependent protein deacetylase n=1 Tax=Bacteroidetes bacterium endosymbiont of Geopemphigus sp. TaxID=2047937 RepID=UPI000CD1ABA8|nr:Sir2 family NAD-dependent protein deacetylase [Bacteroidetes bacterium endosymbiont of Geopemphigus sp.]
MQKLIVLSGAGISAESGLRTFRDVGGLWEGHDVMTVVSPEGWKNNPKLVLDFYNQRRRELKKVKPNEAHLILKELEAFFEVFIITQNVDDLHERAGSKNVLHLHGELLKVRSERDENLIYNWTEDLHLEDKAQDDGDRLRPHIVWFGEEVPMIKQATTQVARGDICLLIGTSLEVCPAASLINYLPSNAKIYVIDPKKPSALDVKNTYFIECIASEGMRILREILLKNN